MLLKCVSSNDRPALIYGTKSCRYRRISRHYRRRYVSFSCDSAKPWAMCTPFRNHLPGTRTLWSCHRDETTRALLRNVGLDTLLHNQDASKKVWQVRYGFLCELSVHLAFWSSLSKIHNLEMGGRWRKRVKGGATTNSPKARMSLWVASCLSLLSALVSTLSQYLHGYSFDCFLGDATVSCFTTLDVCWAVLAIFIFLQRGVPSASPFFGASLSSLRFWYCSGCEPRSCLLRFELDLKALLQKAQGYGLSSEWTANGSLDKFCRINWGFRGSHLSGGLSDYSASWSSKDSLPGRTCIFGLPLPRLPTIATDSWLRSRLALSQFWKELVQLELAKAVSISTLQRACLTVVRCSHSSARFAP